MNAAVALVRKAVGHPIARQFVRFALVGGFATAVQYAILILLVELGGFDPVVATTIGFTIAAVANYSLNRLVTFTERPAFGVGLVKFFGVALVGAGFNALIVATLKGLGLHYILAQLVATGTVMIWNFTANRTLVFRRQSHTPAP
jgi:putative flippase GtrA